VRKSEVFKFVKEWFKSNPVNFQVSTREDVILFKQSSDVHEAISQFRRYNMNIVRADGDIILLPKFESFFDKFTISELKYKNRGIFYTIGIGGADIPIRQNLSQDPIETEEQLMDYLVHMRNYVNYVEKHYYIPFQDWKNIGLYINRFAFPEKAAPYIPFAALGGKFPIEFYKQIYLLHLAGCMERYNEYKQGTLMRINRAFSNNAINEEEHQFYIKNLNLLVDYLENGKEYW